MTLRSLCVIALVGALGLAACGSDDASPATEAPATQGPAATAAKGAAFNDADVTFARGMIPHHEQAIEMADIALDPKMGASEQVRDLATRIKGGQDPEIELMTGWLTAWGQPVEAEMGDGHDMSSMDGMMTAEEMDALGTITAADFDRMWMGMMIRHHQGAIAMAQTVKAAGSSPDVLALADQVITVQQAEITEMQSLLAG
jgi:uncharacterized protein (DUF305 family)